MSGAQLVNLLREYGWILNLFFIALGAYFLAGAVNAVVARSIRVMPTAEAVSEGRLERRPSRQTTEFSAISARNLFGAKKDVVEAQTEETEANDPAVALGPYRYEDLKRCTLPASVRGTLVAEGAPEWSVAVIYLNNSRETQVFSINEGHNEISSDAVLVDVLDREVVVRRTDHFELCPAEGEKGAATTPSRPPLRPAPSTGGGGEGVTKVSATEYRIDGEYLDDTLTNLNKVATQARIVPSFRNGKANGFKLFSIKPGSIYSKIGLQNGDVIQKVNGYEINSPDKALALYQKLRDASSVSIELMRRGRNTNLSYSIDR